MHPAQGYRFPEPVSYLEALALQEELLALRLKDQIQDTFLFLEHKPVITLGRRGRMNHLRQEKEYYTEKGIEIHTASRGGDITWHGPGQLVLYPIRKLNSSHDYLSQLEEVAIQTCKAFDINSFRKEGMAGAWTDSGKIAAIGFKLSKWVSYHGMSFNVCPNLREGFGTIVGCGLEGSQVSSLQHILNENSPSVDQVQEVMQQIIESVFELKLELKNNTSALKKVFENT